MNVSGEATTQDAGDTGRAVTSRTLTQRTCLDLPPAMSLQEWVRVGRQVLAVGDSSRWWLGDWLVYGQAQYPDRYRHAIAQTGLDYQTLRNYAWVARRYPVSRRRDDLSFQHHAELTGMDDAEQDRWMERAGRFRWSRAELRRQLRANRVTGRAKRAAARPDQLRLKISVPTDRRRRWADAATAAEQDLTGWIVEILDEAASSVAAVPEPELEIAR